MRMYSATDISIPGHLQEGCGLRRCTAICREYMTAAVSITITTHQEDYTGPRRIAAYPGSACQVHYGTGNILFVSRSLGGHFVEQVAENVSLGTNRVHVARNNCTVRTVCIHIKTHCDPHMHDLQPGLIPHTRT